MMLVAHDTIAVLDRPLDTGISRAVERDGDLTTYDPRIREVLCPLIPQGGTVVDGGAFIGDHTVAYAEAVGPAGHVWAFECSPNTLECLYFNTKALPQVHVVSAALAEQRGAVTIWASWGVASCDAIGRAVPEGIPTVPLDAFTFDRLDYVKLDLEGYELKALRGAEGQLRRHRPVVVVESGRQLARYGDSRADLLACMTDLGYHGEILPFEHPYHDVFDMLFRPEPRA